MTPLPQVNHQDLSIKINGETLKDIKAHELLKYVVEDSFRRGYEFEVMQAQKTARDTYGWLTTTFLDLVSKISKFKLTVIGEILQPAIASTENPSHDGEIRCNCLVLIAKGLNLTKTIEQVVDSLRGYMGSKNIASIYFPWAIGNTHLGIANVKCLNAAVYKQYLRKTTRLHNKWIDLQPHSNSLDGSAKPNEEVLKQFGFMDVITALASTVKGGE